MMPSPWRSGRGIMAYAHGHGERNVVSAAAFDTCTAAKRLRDAGFDEHQAEAAITMVREAVGTDRDVLATKVDPGAAETRLTNSLASRAELRDAMTGLRDAVATDCDAIARLRWTTGLLAAFMFAIGLRVFGII